MRWSLLLLLLVSCAHDPAPAPAAPKPTTVEPPPAEKKLNQASNVSDPCTEVTPELTLAPLPPAELQRVAKDDFITLRRGQCFGRCPIYSVTVHADGHVEANGEQHVAALGPQNWQIDAGVATRLLAEMVRNNVWALDPKMDAHVTDLPTARLEGRVGGHSVSVRHYGAGGFGSLGGRDFATASRLETLIDLISEAETRVVGCAAKM
jgi:hypothetical protein